MQPYLDLDWPAEVGHIHVEGDVVVKSEVKLFTRETVTVLFNVHPRYDGHLLTWDGSSCEEQKKVKKQIRFLFYFNNNHSWLVVIIVFNNQFSANMTNAFISRKFITVHEKR